MIWRVAWPRLMNTVCNMVLTEANSQLKAFKIWKITVTYKTIFNKNRRFLKKSIMKTLNHLSIIICSFIVLSTLSGAAHARFKCWTNNEGVRECGEKVPPEFAQKGHQKMSNHGVVLEKKERAKTEEELVEEKKLAKLEAEQKKLEDEKAQQNRILLDTFVTATDIEASRDGKIAVIESDIALTNKRNEKTQEDLDKRIRAAANAERVGNAPNEALLSDIELLRSRIEKNNQFIVNKRKEKDLVTKESNNDIERFKKLKGVE